MKFFEGKAGELPVWQLLLVAAVAVVLGCVVFNLVSTQNMVTSGVNGSFLRTSYFGPLSAERKAEIGTNFDKAAAEKAAAKA